jgi:hypothetical protein
MVIGRWQAVVYGHYRLIGGRFEQRRDPQVIVINEAMARQPWKNEEPTGKRFIVGLAKEA